MASKHEGRKIVSPEKIEINTYYSFTLAPNDSKQYFGTSYDADDRYPNPIVNTKLNDRIKKFQTYFIHYFYKYFVSYPPFL